MFEFLFDLDDIEKSLYQAEKERRVCSVVGLIIIFIVEVPKIISVREEKEEEEEKKRKRRLGNIDDADVFLQTSSDKNRSFPCLDSSHISINIRTFVLFRFDDKTTHRE